MDIHHVRYFLAVCETRNFTRAAEKCHVTQPALSRAIQQLEDEIGGLLFRRERNLTHLTDLGLLLQPRFETILTGLSEVKSEASKFLCMEDAALKLGVMCTIGPRRFTGLLADFNLKYPGVQLQLVEGVPSKLAAMLEAGEIDVALMANAEGSPERFDWSLLYRERFLLAFPAGHPLLKHNAVPIGALDGQNYLRRLNCEYREYLSEVCALKGVQLSIAYASEKEDWIQNMVAGGLGICFIPEFSAIVPGLMVRPVIDPEVWREICLVTVAGRRFSPAVAAFVRTIKSYNWAASSLEFA
jgi:LysR family hydrogen peroxide-inducible transcriptional activator